MPDSYQHILDVISTTYPHLTSLALVSHAAMIYHWPCNCQELRHCVPLIRMHHLRPILNLPNPNFLSIGDNLPLGLDLEDVTLLSQHLPNLETTLSKCNSHSRPSTPLALEALVPLPQCCPRPEVLVLFVDATVGGDVFEAPLFPLTFTLPVIESS